MDRTIGMRSSLRSLSSESPMYFAIFQLLKVIKMKVQVATLEN